MNDLPIGDSSFVGALWFSASELLGKSAACCRDCRPRRASACKLTEGDGRAALYISVPTSTAYPSGFDLMHSRTLPMV